MILAYTQAPEVLEPSCAICLERLPNVRYTHPTSTHLAICSDCDATQEFTECPVCKQVINKKETLNEKEKRNLKKKLLRAKKTEESVRNALILREEQEKVEIKARKERAWSLLMEAYAFIEHNDFESAEHLYKALELDPKNYELWFHLGRVQLKLNRVDEALTTFDYALELNCSDAHLVEIAFTICNVLWTDAGRYENMMKNVIKYVSRVKNEKDLEPDIGAMYHLLMGVIDRCQNLSMVRLKNIITWRYTLRKIFK